MSGQNIPYADMTKARQDFIAAWRAWLATRPGADDVQIEREGTGKAMADLATLEYREP